MSRVTVIGHEDRVGDVVDLLQRQGNVEVTLFGTDLSDEERRCHGCPFEPGATLARLEGLLSELKYTIDFMAKHHRIPKTMLENFTGYRLRMTASEWDRLIQGESQAVSELYGRARSLDEELTVLAAEEAKAASGIEALQAWLNAGFRIDQSRAGQFVTVVMGTLAADTCESSLSEISRTLLEFAWEVVGTLDKVSYVVIAYPTSVEEVAAQTLAAHGFSRASFSGFSDTPANEIEKLEAELERIHARRAEVMGMVEAFVSERPRAFALYDHLARERDKLAIVANFGGTKRTFVIEGWARTRDLPAIRGSVEGEFPDVVVLDRPAMEGEQPPVDLVNGPLAYPFEAVTRIMGLPKVGGIDPSPLLAPFFFVFFGVCLTDAPYGVALAVIGYLLLKKTRAKGMGRQLLFLIMAGGLSTFIMGALFGGWFGDLFARVFGLRPIWFDPLKEPLKFLLLAFGLGVIQIFFGLAVKAYDNIRRGNPLAALFDQGFWAVFLIGLGLTIGGGSLGPGVAKAARYVAIVGALGLVATQGRHHKNPLMRVGSGLLSLYSTTSYVSDVVSYARLFGLGFTTAVLGMVINDIALRPAGIPIVGPIIVVVGLAFGHAFNLLINVIGAYVHSSRLQYVEFFSKFYETGGKRFSPFRVTMKYVEVDNPKEA
ncbi:MAG: V-type ATP synthase subunit I [Firmicutes bacterium]|jgi:V/A-type H+-transporting ATPase subunit I|nr:V-type ATP synthase subunit I [Bacillota bacterium]